MKRPVITDIHPNSYHYNRKDKIIDRPIKIMRVAFNEIKLKIKIIKPAARISIIHLNARPLIK